MAANSNQTWASASMKRVVIWLARRYTPELVAERRELLESAKHLGAKLAHARAEKEEWRQRCFSAENAISNAKREIQKELERHDREQGTMLHWR